MVSPVFGAPEIPICQKCLPGRYAPFGSLECFDCDLGMLYFPSRLLSLTLLSGEYSNLTGASHCELCDPGSYAIDTASTACSLCRPGSYSDQHGSPYCDPCAPGSYQPSFGETTCLICENGTVAASFNSSYCTPCPEGKYQPRPGIIILKKTF